MAQLRFAKLFGISIVAKMSLRNYGISYVSRSLLCVSSSITDGVHRAGLEPATQCFTVSGF